MTIEKLINELRKEPNTQKEVYVGVTCASDGYYGHITSIGNDPDTGLFWIYGEEK